MTLHYELKMLLECMQFNVMRKDEFLYCGGISCDSEADTIEDHRWKLAPQPQRPFSFGLLKTNSLPS